jgi:Transposase DDE domain
MAFRPLPPDRPARISGDSRRLADRKILPHCVQKERTIVNLLPHGSPSEALTAKTSPLKEKIEKLKEDMQRLESLKVQMLATPDQQISLTDPDSRSIATSGRGSGIVGYNVQVAVDTAHHLIITHEVTNVGTDRSQLAHVAKEMKTMLEVEKLDAVADRGYFSSEPSWHAKNLHHGHPAKANTSHSTAEGRFGRQDFRYLVEEDVYICRAAEQSDELAPPHVGPPPPESVYCTFNLPQSGCRVLCSVDADKTSRLDGPAA